MHDAVIKPLVISKTVLTYTPVYRLIEVNHMSQDFDSKRKKEAGLINIDSGLFELRSVVSLFIHLSTKNRMSEGATLEGNHVI